MIGPNVGGAEDYQDGYNEGHADGMIQGLVDAPMFNDYLATMRRDQLDVFGVDVGSKTDDEKRTQIVGHAYACIEEIAEMMREITWKPWKKSEGVPLCDPRRVAAEAVDALHFLAHVLNYSGVDDDMLNEAMAAARAKNARRQSEGYRYS